MTAFPWSKRKQSLQNFSKERQRLLQGLQLNSRKVQWFETLVDLPPGYQCPRSYSKSVPGDRNLLTTALPSDPLTAKPRSYSPLTATRSPSGCWWCQWWTNIPSRNGLQKMERKNWKVYKTFWHTLPGNAKKVGRIDKKISHWRANFIILNKNNAEKNFFECQDETLSSLHGFYGEISSKIVAIFPIFLSFAWIDQRSFGYQDPCPRPTVVVQRRPRRASSGSLSTAV